MQGLLLNIIGVRDRNGVGGEGWGVGGWGLGGRVKDLHGAAFRQGRGGGVIHRRRD